MTPEDDSDVFLSPLQVRRKLGISPRTLQRWVARGALKPAGRLPNGHARFSSRDIYALLNERQGEDQAQLFQELIAVAEKLGLREAERHLQRVIAFEMSQGDEGPERPTA